MRSLSKFLFATIPGLLFVAVVSAVIITSLQVRAEPAASSTTRVSLRSTGTEGNGNSFEAAISADERYVAFSSGANNLVGDDANGVWDVFVHDRQTGQTERISVASDGSEGNGNSTVPAISADGRYVGTVPYHCG